ncbi:cartilage intermediate layer protein 1-like [Nerophis lumbriciformis]|uniref:cartilage intermediate layer protein 1-like n=2 Tax=Nerophis lumbriciformis TaxID=546530 RepID=UPI002AE0AB60|nr:cartilage intermediate layer protein 1-like [Nerophis lumbriciformis]
MDSTGDVVAVADTTSGFICRNSDQNTGMCSDYRVRFRCPVDYCQQKDCWTPWFDRDNPSGTGDYETLKNLYKENPNKICKAPIDIEVQTTSGLSMDSTGDVVAVADTTSGFICRNSDQNTGMCSDYRVRFRCPYDYCQRKG